MKMHLAIAASAFALIAAPVLAQDAAGEHEFPMSRADFMAAYPELTPEEFPQVDADGDDEVSQEEYDAAREAGVIGEADDDA